MILVEELNQYYSRNVVMDKYAETLAGPAHLNLRPTPSHSQ